jgi:hypothetical protein
VTEQDRDQEILHVIRQYDEAVSRLECLDSKAERFADALSQLAADLQSTDIEAVFSRTEYGYTASLPDTEIRRISTPDSLGEAVTLLLERAETRVALNRLRDRRRKLRIDPA